MQRRKNRKGKKEEAKLSTVGRRAGEDDVNKSEGCMRGNKLRTSWEPIFPNKAGSMGKRNKQMWSLSIQGYIH